jgi:ergothioneine biosynthesis protein EgtB
MAAIAEHAEASQVSLRRRFAAVRQASIEMCSSLEPEEYRVQPLEEVSPPWWNLGHTSWFFARNMIVPFGGETDPRDAEYDYLLNSYYESLGERLARGKRGSITRPTTAEIYDYRASVDRRMNNLFESIEPSHVEEFSAVARIGIEHEQQHQELFATEIKCILAQNPRHLRRSYSALPERPAAQEATNEAVWICFAGGLTRFGNLERLWCWDNELPVHQQYLEPFSLSDQLVTNAEYLQFIDDGGYRNPLLWLDNAWQQCREQRWQAPMYWEQVDGDWQRFSLQGMQPLRPDEPVCHVGFYEADAFARWRRETWSEQAQVRLPTEREWEHAARTGSDRLLNLHRCLWQWTASYYEPYPGYRPFRGALAEYNGKFMDNQRVLRGGSWATPESHYRLSYRNFWPAGTRFQFTGIRLACDGE